MLRAGERIGRYTLRHRLGTGSFAEVWRATERGEFGFTTDVALKILHPERCDEASLAALLKEAALGAALHHPNIVEVRRVELLGDRVLVVMELVEGGTLTRLLTRAAAQGLALPASVVTDIGIDLARGLEHAWSGRDGTGGTFGVVHRDLKPANVLLERTGEAKITDFGIAKARGDVAATATGMLKGTPCYIAPETWVGGRDFRPTVDLFAVGCVLYELLTQRRLFEAESVVGVVAQITAGLPAEEVAPIQRRFGALARVVEELIQRDPAARTQSASELLARLRAIRAELGPDGDVATFLAALDAIEGGGAQWPPLRLPRTSDPDWSALAARLGHATRPLDEAIPRGTPEPALAAPSSEEPALEPGTTRLMPVRRGPWVVALAGVGAALAAVLLLTVLGVLALDQPAELRVAAAGPESVESPAGQRRADLALVPPSMAGSSATADPVRTAPRDRGPGGETAEAPRPVAPSTPPPTGQTERPTPRPEPSTTPGEASISSADEGSGGSQGEPASSEVAGPDGRDVMSDTQDEAQACLVLVSDPVGALVWLDGRRRARPAGGSARGGERLPPGSVEIGMGEGVEPSVRTDVRLVAGVATVVRCDLSARRTCTVWTGDFGLCR